MEIRLSGPTHLAKLHALFSSALEFDRFSKKLLKEKLFENPRPKQDVYKTWTAWDGAKLAGVMQSVTRPAEKRAWIGLFAVSSTYGRRSVATDLFDRILAEWNGLGIQEAGVLAIPGNYFTPGLDPRYTAAVGFLERMGFERYKDCVNLTADLRKRFSTADEETKLKSQRIEIRRAIKGDGPRLDSFFNANFGADWRLEADKSLKLSPPALHLALRSGRILAFSAHSGMNREWGFFGPMGTSPQAIGKGLGRVLLFRCLEDLRKAGHKTAIIPWVGPISFYTRNCACRVERVLWQYRRHLTPKNATVE